MNGYDEQLTAELRSRASDAAGPGVTLHDVKRTAHRLRWQRRAMAGTAAAVVLAIAVPIGLSVTGGEPTGPDLAPSPSPSPSPYPSEPQQVVLRTDVTELSGEPEVPYLFEGAINLPDGSRVQVTGSYSGVAAFGDGWMLTRSDDSGNFFVDIVDAQGNEIASYPSTGVALSRDHTLLSYFDPSDDSLHVVAAAGLQSWTLPTDGDPELGPAAVLGSETCEGDGSDGCTVYFNDHMGGVAGVSSSDGSVRDDESFQEVAGVDNDGDVSGQISYTDLGSCSAIRSASGETVWETCDHSLGRFSPDNRLVLGYPAYRDGFGDGVIAILDAETGDLYAEFKNNAKSQAMVTNVVWETDTTLLATVFQKGQWSLMRMSAYGDLTKVTDFAGDDMSPGLVLPNVP